MLARQESLVAEAIGGQAGKGKRVKHGRGARRAGDGQAAFNGAAHNGQAWIVDGGHAGVGNDEHGRTGFDLIKQTVGLVSLVVVMVGDDSAVHIDAEAASQVEQAAGVFCGYDVGTFQKSHQTSRSVADVADWGRSEYHSASRNSHSRLASLGSGRFAGINPIVPIVAFRHLCDALFSVTLFIQLICACHTPSIAQAKEQSAVGSGAFCTSRG